MESRWPEQNPSAATGGVQLPESPTEPMEFLARSWSPSAFQLSRALAPLSPKSIIPTKAATMSADSGSSDNSSSTKTEEITGVGEAEESAVLTRSTFSFASSATSLLVLERIMSQSDISPLTSGRLSHGSEPLNASLPEEMSPDGHQLSPSEYDDVVKFLGANNTLQPLFATNRNAYGTGGSNTPGGKTVGRWLKGRREKKKEDTRTHNAQIHAAVSVAGVAAAVAAIAAATAATSASRNDEQMAKTEMAVASAATLVAAQCVEAAESMGAERDHLISAVNSAVNVRSHGDILTLTAAAATALRGAATLKARALKEVWNIAAVIPIDKGLGMGVGQSDLNGHAINGGYCEELFPEESFIGACNQELLARGTELLKRTRNGDLHWKVVSVYIHRTGQVMLKMKSKHVASTITKKKKNVVLEVCKNVPEWPGRHLLESGEQRGYFGLRTTTRVIEFECKNKREYEMWIKGVSRLLSIASDTKNKQPSCLR